MPEGLRLTKNSDAAIIVLHEIYGINPFMHAVCQKYHSLGYDASVSYTHLTLPTN